MQTKTLPILVTGAVPAAPRAPQPAPEGAAPFSQSLSRANAQRSDNAAQPAPKQAPPAKPAAADKVPAKQAEAAKPAEPAKPADAKPASSADSAAVPAEQADDSAAAAAAAAADAAVKDTPVADMLALVASLQPEKLLPTPAPAAIAPALTASGAVRAAIKTDPNNAMARLTLPEDAAADSGAFDAALADVAAATTVDAAAPALPAASAPASGAEPVAVDQSALLALAQARPAAARSAAGAEAQPVKAAALASTAPLDTVQAPPTTPAERAASVLPPPAAPAEARPGEQQAAAPRAELAAAVAAPAVRTVAEPAAAKTPEPAIRELAAAPVSAPVQQASLSLAQAAAGVATDKIAARVGTPVWDNQVGQRIVWMVAGKEQSATLTLNPPDLGPMQVVLSVNNDQATVTFTSAQPEVRAALENAMPRLREMLDESGVALSNASVSAGMPDQRQAQGEAGRSAPPGSGGNAPNGFATNGSASEAAARSASRPTPAGNGLVDTFA
jgi:flagellar hook-length control protein FliK